MNNDMSKVTRRVVLYTGIFPNKNDSGAQIRLSTNIRAYTDLGFDAEVVFVNRSSPSAWPQGLDVSWRHLPVPAASPTLPERIGYYSGYPFDLALNYQFPFRKTIREDIQNQQQRWPTTLFHFEYLSTASAVIGYPGIRSVFSSHDLESERKQIVSEFRSKSGRTGSNRTRSGRIIARAERLAVNQASLVLAIARHEADLVRNEWGCDHVELFPMSWTEENPVSRRRTWVDGGKLRLFHLGKIDTLLSYHSLRFLFEEVFPCLKPEVLANLEMDVVGNIPDTTNARHVLDLAKPYQNVKFHGYQADTKPFYAEADLQVVGATVATGLRTRIIESFVFGVPVLSTRIGAQGVDGLMPDRNILLAEDATAFADQLERVWRDPTCLPELARFARQTYDQLYSRPVAAACLKQAIEKYIFRKEENLIHA